MTKQEFISKQQAYKNISGKGAVIAVSLVFAFSCSVVGIVVLMSVVKDQVRPAWFQNAIFSTSIAFLTVFIVVSFQLLLRNFRLRMAKLGLLCTGCGAPLIGTASRVVIATGCCKRCGKRAINELPDA